MLAHDWNEPELLAPGADAPGSRLRSPTGCEVVGLLERSCSATNADGEFRLTFKSGNTLTLTATPAGGGAPDTRDGRFTVEGRQVHATLSTGDPMVLTFVNEGYESTSFGLPMRL